MANGIVSAATNLLDALDALAAQQTAGDDYSEAKVTAARIVVQTRADQLRAVLSGVEIEHAQASASSFQSESAHILPAVQTMADFERKVTPEAPTAERGHYLVTPKNGGKSYTSNKAPDSWELRECDIQWVPESSLQPNDQPAAN